MRSRLWNRLILLAVIGLTALSVIIVWPSEPERYLPDAINWPEGKGIKLKLPTIEGGTFGLETIERRAMSLGLDLRGGTRLVLEPEEGEAAKVEDLDQALDGARDVIERRVNAFGVAESEVNRLGDNRLAVQLPGISPDEAIDKIGRTALLQFCEPFTNESGQVATLSGANRPTAVYQSQTCQPELDAEGIPLVQNGSVEFANWSISGQDNPSSERIIWKPATAEIDGQEVELTGEFLRPNVRVEATSSVNNPLGQPILFFEFNSEGADVAEQVTTRLRGDAMPMAFFLDGEPIEDSNGIPIAPTVQGVISNSGVINGLGRAEAFDLRTLLNSGAFPIALRVVQQQDVDATLGETAVRNSVIAGEIALLVIMLFMVLYYRLPGLMAALALVVYTSFVLAIFKLWPVTLTLAGVAAFVLSVGMAVDANILIFERMKEELRVGRNLVAALEDGFSRAWSSIRDSNVSTLITCGILYWFGDQFNESAIKGFAITLAIGVLVSMFSAITVTRVFMHLVISIRPLARRLWLFIPDLPEGIRQQDVRRVPAVAGGSGTTPRWSKKERDGA
jgi:preprotein translocase subunit SecD